MDSLKRLEEVLKEVKKDLGDLNFKKDDWGNQVSSLMAKKKALEAEIVVLEDRRKALDESVKAERLDKLRLIDERSEQVEKLKSDLEAEKSRLKGYSTAATLSENIFKKKAEEAEAERLKFVAQQDSLKKKLEKLEELQAILK